MDNKIRMMECFLDLLAAFTIVALIAFACSGCARGPYLVKYYDSDTGALRHVAYVEGERPSPGVGGFKLENQEINGWWEVEE